MRKKNREKKQCSTQIEKQTPLVTDSQTPELHSQGDTTASETNFVD